MSARKRKITDFFGGNSENKNGEEDITKLKCPKITLFEKKSSKSVSKSRSRTAEKLDLTQRILDLGQAQIGNIYCEKCNMMYCVDSVEERERHQIYHNRFKDTANFNINKSLIDVIKTNCAKKLIDDYWIVYVGTSSPKIVKNSVEYWMKFVNEAIGYVNETSVWNSNRRVYLSIALSQESELFLSGMLVTEKLSQAITEKTEEIVKKRDDDDDDWIVGVDRIWIHPTKRRCGIGSALLDAATTREKDLNFRQRRLRIAFSELSEEGGLFARKYVKLHYTADEKFGEQLLTY